MLFRSLRNSKTKTTNDITRIMIRQRNLFFVNVTHKNSCIIYWTLTFTFNVYIYFNQFILMKNYMPGQSMMFFYSKSELQCTSEKYCGPQRRFLRKCEG